MPVTDIVSAVSHHHGQLVSSDATSHLIAHSPFVVEIPCHRVIHGGCSAVSCSFDKRFPLRLQGKISPQQFTNMVSEIEDILNEGIQDANRAFQQYNLPFVIGGVATLGIGMLVLWPLLVVAHRKCNETLLHRVKELREWIDDQNESQWLPQGIQFALVQSSTALPVTHQQYLTLDNYSIVVEVAAGVVNVPIRSVANNDSPRLDEHSHKAAF